MDYIEKNERQNEYLHRFQLRELAEAWLAQAAAECPADPYSYLITEATQQRERGGGIATCPNPWCEMTMPAADFNTHSLTCKDEQNWLRCVRCNGRVEVSRAAQHALHCRVQSCPLCGEIVLPRLMPLCPFKIFQAAERDRLAFAYRHREEAEKVEAASEALALALQQQQQTASVSRRLLTASPKSPAEGGRLAPSSSAPLANGPGRAPLPALPRVPSKNDMKKIKESIHTTATKKTSVSESSVLVDVSKLSDKCVPIVQTLQKMWRRMLVVQRFRTLFFRIIWSRLDLMQEKSVSAPPKNKDSQTKKITAKTFPRWSSAREHSNDESFMLELQSLLQLNGDDAMMHLERDEERSDTMTSVNRDEGTVGAVHNRNHGISSSNNNINSSGSSKNNNNDNKRESSFAVAKAHRHNQGSKDGSGAHPHRASSQHALLSYTTSSLSESIDDSVSSSARSTHENGGVAPQRPPQRRRSKALGRLHADELPSVIGSVGSEYGEDVLTLYTEPDANGAYMSVADMDELIRLNHFRAVLPIRTVIRIIRVATGILATRPVVQHVVIPPQGDVVVVGDLHGQMKDIYHIIQLMGRPSAERHFVFNGDFVDRGPNCCEVIVYVFALLCTYPNYVHINRGNHEDAHTNTEYGLLTELFGKYKSAAPFLHQELINSYEAMPLMTVLDRRVLVVHGGVPRVACTLAELESIGRVRDIPVAEQTSRAEQLLVDVLWNDPVEQYRSRALGTRHNGDGWRSSRRGCGVEYVAAVTDRFLRMNDLSLVIRSHDVKMPGFEIAHHSRTVTVFSASNYGGVSGNRGAVAVVKKSADMPLFQTWFLREDIQGAGLLTQLTGATGVASSAGPPVRPPAARESDRGGGGGGRGGGGQEEDSRGGMAVAAEMDLVARGAAAAATAGMELYPLGPTPTDASPSPSPSPSPPACGAPAAHRCHASVDQTRTPPPTAGANTVSVNAVADAAMEQSNDGTSYSTVPNMAKVEEEILVRSDEFVQTFYENFGNPTPLLTNNDVSDEELQRYRGQGTAVAAAAAAAPEVSYRTCLPIIMQMGVMYELREMIYTHRYTLLIGFTAADDARTGMIYEMEWCAVMRDVLRIDLPWYYIFRFVNPEVLLLDGIRSVQYVKFLRRFDAAFTANHLYGWQRALVRRIFVAADLPDDLIATFGDSCVYRLSESGDGWEEGLTGSRKPNHTGHSSMPSGNGHPPAFAAGGSAGPTPTTTTTAAAAARCSLSNASEDANHTTTTSTNKNTTTITNNNTSADTNTINNNNKDFSLPLKGSTSHVSHPVSNGAAARVDDSNPVGRQAFRAPDDAAQLLHRYSSSNSFPNHNHLSPTDNSTNPCGGGGTANTHANPSPNTHATPAHPRQRAHLCTRVGADGGPSTRTILGLEELGEGGGEGAHTRHGGEAERWRYGVCSFRVFASRIRSMAAAAAVLEDNLVYSLFEYFDQSMRGHVTLGALADLVAEVCEAHDDADSSDSLQLMESDDFSFTVPVLPSAVDGAPAVVADADRVVASEEEEEEEESIAVVATTTAAARAASAQHTPAVNPLTRRAGGPDADDLFAATVPTAGELTALGRPCSSSSSSSSRPRRTGPSSLAALLHRAKQEDNHPPPAMSPMREASLVFGFDYAPSGNSPGRAGSLSNLANVEDSETEDGGGECHSRWTSDVEVWEQRRPSVGSATAAAAATGANTSSPHTSDAVALSMEDNGPQLQFGKLGQWSTRGGGGGGASHAKKPAWHAARAHPAPLNAATSSAATALHNTRAAAATAEVGGPAGARVLSPPRRNGASNDENSCRSSGSSGSGSGSGSDGSRRVAYDSRVDVWLYPFLLRMQDIFLGGSTYTRMRTLFQMLNESKDGRLSCEELLKLVEFVNSQIDSPISDEQARVVFHHIRQEGMAHNRLLHLMQQERYARSMRLIHGGAEGEGESAPRLPPPPLQPQSRNNRWSGTTDTTNTATATRNTNNTNNTIHHGGSNGSMGYNSNNNNNNAKSRRSAFDNERMMCTAHTPAYPTLKERLEEEQRAGKAFILFPELVGLFTVNAVLSDRMGLKSGLTASNTGVLLAAGFDGDMVLGEGSVAATTTSSSSFSGQTGARTKRYSSIHTHTPSASSVMMHTTSNSAPMLHEHAGRGRVAAAALGANSAQLSNAAAREMAKRRGSVEMESAGLTTSQQMLQTLANLQESYGPAATLRDVMMTLNRRISEKRVSGDSGGAAGGVKESSLNATEALPPQQRQLSKRHKNSVASLLRKHVKPVRSRSPVLPGL